MLMDCTLTQRSLFKLLLFLRNRIESKKTKLKQISFLESLGGCGNSVWMLHSRRGAGRLASDPMQQKRWQTGVDHMRLASVLGRRCFSCRKGCLRFSTFSKTIVFVRRSTVLKSKNPFHKKTSFPTPIAHFVYIIQGHQQRDRREGDRHVRPFHVYFDEANRFDVSVPFCSVPFAVP